MPAPALLVIETRTRCDPRLRRDSFSVRARPRDLLTRHTHPPPALLALDRNPHRRHPGRRDRDARGALRATLLRLRRQRGDLSQRTPVRGQRRLSRAGVRDIRPTVTVAVDRRRLGRADSRSKACRRPSGTDRRAQACRPDPCRYREASSRRHHRAGRDRRRPGSRSRSYRNCRSRCRRHRRRCRDRRHRPRRPRQIVPGPRSRDDAVVGGVDQLVAVSVVALVPDAVRLAVVLVALTDRRAVVRDRRIAVVVAVVVAASPMPSPSGWPDRCSRTSTQLSDVVETASPSSSSHASPMPSRSVSCLIVVVHGRAIVARRRASPSPSRRRDASPGAVRSSSGWSASDSGSCRCVDHRVSVGVTVFARRRRCRRPARGCGCRGSCRRRPRRRLRRWYSRRAVGFAARIAGRSRRRAGR